ncbi:MAG TPA: hypothetical protein VMP01_03025, partial [Pirellulaceae bacterium]|nr:hypothetical protein [Pirellulaceae bacterium]
MKFDGHWIPGEFRPGLDNREEKPMDETIRRRYAIVSDYIHSQTEEAWERLRQRIGQECRQTAAKRPAHFQQYADMTEVV